MVAVIPCDTGPVVVSHLVSFGWSDPDFRRHYEDSGKIHANLNFPPFVEPARHRSCHVMIIRALVIIRALIEERSCLHPPIPKETRS